MGLLEKIKLFIKEQIIRLNQPMVMRVVRKGKTLYLSNKCVITDEVNVNWGNNVFVNHFSVIDGYNGISIGDHCQICVNVGIYTHSAHNTVRLYGPQYFNVPFSEHRGRITGAVEIGEYSFIGPNTLIMPGTKIGKGCIIAAYSYVKGVFPDYSIISGNPARIVGETTSRDKRLLREYPELEAFYYMRHSKK